MQVTTKKLSDTKVQLTIVADEKQLQDIKKATLEHVAVDISLPGFRKGKAPLNLVEKNANPATLQTEFLDRAMNAIYVAALEQERLRPVSQPQVKIKKFVAFDTLEIELEVEVVGEIVLGDYKKIKLAKKTIKITAKDVDEVLEQLRGRDAERKEVDRAAKNGDEVLIDFKGVDAKTNEPINGADGKDYPLVLGSNSFIPGFEADIVGIKTGEEKSFTLTFPKDYSVKTLQNRKVTFTVTAKKVQEIVEAKLDDDFAAKVGPFKNLAELKTDIEKQLQSEKNYQLDREYTDQLLTEITNKSKAAVPEILVTEQIDRLLNEQKQNIMYRGQTWEEFLEGQGTTEEKHRETLRKDAELRVKAGLVLGEIAEKEKIIVTPEELEIRIQLLKGQYPDKQMQAELQKPESRREIASRMVSEKTVDKLVSYATAKASK